jgi:hypothetical protein
MRLRRLSPKLVAGLSVPASTVATLIFFFHRRQKTNDNDGKDWKQTKQQKARR